MQCCVHCCADQPLWSYRHCQTLPYSHTQICRLCATQTWCSKLNQGWLQVLSTHQLRCEAVVQAGTTLSVHDHWAKNATPELILLGHRKPSGIPRALMFVATQQRLPQHNVNAPAHGPIRSCVKRFHARAAEGAKDVQLSWVPDPPYAQCNTPTNKQAISNHARQPGYHSPTLTKTTPLSGWVMSMPPPSRLQGPVLTFSSIALFCR